MAGAGDAHRLACERAGVEPRQLVVQGRNLTHDDDGGVRQAALGRVGCDGVQAPDGDALGGPGAALDDGRRRLAGHAVRHEALGDDGQVLHAHEEHEGAPQVRHLLPVHGRGQLRGVLVAGDHRERRGHPAVRHGDARIRRRGDAGRDARHHGERDAVGSQLLGLLAAAAEHERVAAFEAHERASRRGLLHEQRVDLVLREGVAVGRLAHVHELACRGRLRDDVRRHEPVVHEHVGALHQPKARTVMRPGSPGPLYEVRLRVLLHKVSPPL